MKGIFEFFGNILEFCGAIMYIVSVYLLIRCSELDLLISNEFMEWLFVTRGEVDSSLMGIIAGYFTGYLVYILTVVIPTYKKRKIIDIEVCAFLKRIYDKSIYMLLLMAKSASNKKQWEDILASDSDTKCFDRTFYTVMSKFDIYAKAEAPFAKKEGCLLWHEYMEYNLSEIYEEVEEYIMKYHIYLSKNILSCLKQWKNLQIMDLALGTGATSYWIVVSEDGTKYREVFPISKFYEQEGMKTRPVFEKSNIDVLKNYVNVLNSTYTVYQKKLANKNMDDAYNIKQFKEHEFGHIGTSVWNIKS